MAWSILFANTFFLFVSFLITLFFFSKLSFWFKHFKWQTERKHYGNFFGFQNFNEHTTHTYIKREWRITSFFIHSFFYYSSKSFGLLCYSRNDCLCFLLNCGSILAFFNFSWNSFIEYILRRIYSSNHFHILCVCKFLFDIATPIGEILEIVVLFCILTENSQNSLES